LGSTRASSHISSGVNLAPRGEPSILFRRMEGQTENFTHRDNFIPRGQSSILGDNFTPGGQILPLGAKLRMGMTLCERIAQFCPNIAPNRALLNKNF
jgi:hypothetical protein